MPPRRRSRGVTKGRAVRTAMRVGNWASLARASRVRSRGVPFSHTTRRVNQLYNMIETKEATRTVRGEVLPHNNITILGINPFITAQAVSGPDNQNTGSRIGDKITLRGMLIRGMLDNSFGRPKVYYRVMLVKYAKGDVPTRATLFKNASNNIMIDQIDTERFSVLAQKIFTVSCSNPAPTGATGVAGAGIGTVTGGLAAGVGSKLIKMWIPGVKFGRGGNIQYETNSGTQVKFFDYRVIVVAYDWYYTGQDINNVGQVSELYTKLYYKDA